LDEKATDGQTRRWAVEGPSILQISRIGFAKDLKPGEIIEVCGYLLKEPIVRQIGTGERYNVSLAVNASASGRLLNAEMMVTPDGKEQKWGDYGVHKCFAPGFTDVEHPSKN